MDRSAFDRLARWIGADTSRRCVLRSAFAAALSGVTGTAPLGAETIAAKKGAKLKRNTYGCVDVGKPCRGRDAVCCSGICKGKRPKKGQRDRSKCVAHNVGGCTLDRALCINPTLAACSKTAKCLVTTGKAPFCAENDFSHEANCKPCGQDADCEAMGFGQGSACVLLHTEGTCAKGCEGINGSQGTACLAPGR